MPFRRESPQPSGVNSERVRKALDSLASDVPVSNSDLASLSEAERVEVAAMTRTAHLARLVLHADQPESGAEATALSRAQTALHGRKTSGAPIPDARSQTSWLGSLLERLRDPENDRR